MNRVCWAIFRLLAGIIAIAACACPETIDGDVVVTRKLTRRTVTPSIATYQRGSAVELKGDTPEDPLAFERSRVVVWIEASGDAGSARPQCATASIEQRGRRFVPDLVVIPAGSTVSFPNLDQIFHNVFSLSKPREFDLGNYARGSTRTLVFPRPGIVYVGCHLHPNMAAAIVITPNSWCTRSSGDGRFRLSGVPPGEYSVVAWHKAAGLYRRRIHVVAGAGAHVEFLIPLRAESGSFDMAEGN